MSEQLSILVIDDSKDDRFLCNRALNRALDGNVSVVEAASGEDGVNLAESQNIDCVLLDYSLPGRNGVEILKRIRVKHPYLPVIMLTGQGNEAVAVQVMKEGAQDYITKSAINEESLYKLVKIAIEHCQMKKRIGEQQTALSLFTRALAHDLKEPVRTIGSFLDLLSAENSFSGKSLNYFERVRTATGNMSNLIDTVFAYTRLSDEKEISKTECDVMKTMENVKANLSQQITESGAQVECGDMPHVYAHEPHIMQILQNLVSNAINYSDKSPPVIRIDAQEKGEMVEFSVKDNGPGIEEKHWQEIFEPFKRLSTSSRKGSGLGLAICRKIVERHGGSIWCNSVVGKGTTFYFSLPSYKAAAQKQDAERKPNGLDVQHCSNGSLANVLLVDDSSADVELTRVLLMERGRIQFNLYTAWDGKKAIEFLENKANPPIHLILLDINMPEMDGFEFLQYCNTNNQIKGCEVIMCSTSNFDDDIKKASELGAAGYLQKPATFKNTSEAISKIKGVVLKELNGGFQLLQAG